jgi:hypothetical protein
VPEGHEVCQSVREVNERALLNADLLVALIPDQMTSIGVPAEIAQAVSYGIDVLMVVTPSLRPSLMLRAWDYELTQEGRGGFVAVANLAQRLAEL